MAAEYDEVMKKLIKTVTRTFYEPHHVVIADILLENILLSDYDFCLKMKMLGREFNKLIIKLKEDRIIKSDIKVESKEDNKQILKNVYFFNFAEVRDIIKYKLFKMNKALEVPKISENEAFYCPTCEKTISSLDAQQLIENFVLKCIFCKGELEENTNNVNGTKLDIKDLLSNMKVIIDLLKEADKYDIPSLDYFQVLELKKQRDAIKESTENSPKTNTEEDKNVLKITENFDEDSSTFENDAIDKSSNTQVNTNNKGEVLTVNGVEKEFFSITEEDKEMMTEEEYIRYFEVFSKYNE